MTGTPPPLPTNQPLPFAAPLAEDDITAPIAPPTLFESPQGPDPVTSSPLYRRAMDERAAERKRDEAAFYEQLGVAMRINPTLRAEANSVAKDLGLDPGIAERNLDVLREVARRRAVARMDLAALNPELADSLANLEFSAVAHQQIDKLAWYERLVRHTVAGQWQDVVGRLSAKARDVGLTPEEEATLRYANQVVDESPSPDLEVGLMGVLSQAARIGGQLTMSLPRAITAGAVVGTSTALIAGAAGGPAAPVTAPIGLVSGFTAGFLGQLGLDTYRTEGGLAYAAMVNPQRPGGPVDAERAKWASRGVGAINAAIEMGTFGLVAAPAKRMMARVLGEAAVEAATRPTIGKAAITFAKEYVRTIVGESGQEVAQELVSAVGEAIAAREPLEGGPLAKRLYDTGVATAQAMIVLGLADGPVSNFLAEARRVKQAKRTAAFYAALADNGKARADFIAANPEIDAAFSQRIFRGTSNETTYVAREEFAAIMQRLGLNADVLERAVPGITDQLRSDAEDVTIPTAVIGSQWANTELEQALRPHMRLSADEPSAAEAKKVGEEEVARLQAELESAATWVNEATQVETDMRQQLVLAGVSHEDAALESQLYRAMVEARARAEGVSPRGYYDAHPYTVVAEQGPQGSTLKQEGRQPTKIADTAEFRKWFGKSRVVDDAGKPRVVYHGSGTSIEQFRYEFTGQGNDQLGSGFYFTSDASEANNYTTRRRNNDEPKPGGEDTPTVHEVYLALTKPLDADKIGAVTPKQAREIIEMAPNLEDGLSNWGDPTDPGTMAEAARAYAGTRVNILGQLHKLANDFFGSDTKAFNTAVRYVLGYDGVVSKQTSGDGTRVHYVAWFPEQIKSVNNRGTFSTTDPNILRQEEKPRPLQFYSALLRAIDALPADKAMTIDQWKQTFATWTNKGTVRKAEFAATGLAEMLDLVTPAEAKSTFTPGELREAFLTRFHRELDVSTWKSADPATVTLWRHDDAKLRRAMNDAHAEYERQMAAYTKLNSRDSLFAAAERELKDQDPRTWRARPSQASPLNFGSGTRRSVVRAVESLPEAQHVVGVTVEGVFDITPMRVTGVDGTPHVLTGEIEAVEFTREAPAAETPGQLRLFDDDAPAPPTEADDGWVVFAVTLPGRESAKFYVPVLGGEIQVWNPSEGRVSALVDGVEFSRDELAALRAEFVDLDAITVDKDIRPEVVRSLADFSDAIENLDSALDAIDTSTLSAYEEFAANVGEKAGALSDAIDTLVEELEEIEDLRDLAADVNYIKEDWLGSLLTDAQDYFEAQDKWEQMVAERVVAMERDAESAGPDPQREELWQRINAARQAYDDAASRVAEHERTSPVLPRFSTYTLPGAEGYTELTLNLTAPSTHYVAPASHTVGNEIGGVADKNRILHARVSTRYTPDGKRVLFVEELQSDWGQQLRDYVLSKQAPKKTGKPEGASSERILTINTARGTFKVLVVDGITYPLLGDVQHAPSPATTIQEHPYVAKTDKWVGLGVAQLLMYAVENGFDKIALPTAEQQMSIYPYLSSVVSSINWQTPRLAHSPSRDTAREMDYAAERAGLHGVALATLLGKDLADKIATSDTDTLTHRELDTRIDVSSTARGMRVFYGTIVPNAFRDFATKIGGGAMTLQPVTNRDSDEPVLTDKEGRESAAQLTLDITDRMRETLRAAGGFPLFQEGEGRAAPRGEFSRQQLRTLLRQGADVSTFVHETAHYYLETLLRLAAAPNASVATATDVATYLRWVGVRDLAEWATLTPEQRAKHHEKFAYSFEAYIFDGKAPTQELQGLFDRFAALLRAVYKGSRDAINAIFRSTYSEDLPELTTDIRGVMDRMVASQEDIDRSLATRARAPLFETPEQAGMSSNEWATYLALDNARRDEAIADLTAARLRNMKWLETERAGVLREIQAEGRVARAAVGAEVRQEMRRDPARRAHEWLRNGRVVNADGIVMPDDAPENHKLSREAVTLLLGADAEKSLRKLRGLLSDTGQSPDTVASLFGFPDGRALVNSLVDLPPVRTDLRQRVNDRMAQAHPDLVPGTTEHRDAVAAALSGEASLRMVATELRAAAKLAGSPRALLAAARVAARRHLAGLPVRELRPDRFDQGAVRAAARAQAALQAGDLPEVARAKRAEMLQRTLASEARRAREEVGKALDRFAEFRRSDKNLSRTRDVRIVAAGRAILGAFGLGTSKVAPLEWLAQVQAYAPALYADLAAIVAQATQRNTLQDYRDLPLDAFRTVRDTVEALWHRSLRDRQVREGKRLTAAGHALELLHAQLDKVGVPTTVPGETSAVTKRDQLMRSVNQTKAMLRRVEHWARSMDGGDAGPFQRFLVRPLWNALTAYRTERNVKIKRLLALVEKVKMRPGTIEAPELGFTFGKGTAGVGTAELLGALLHTGNRSNLNKLLGGRASWATRDAKGDVFVDADGNVDRTKWDKFVQRMIDKGELTKEHFDFVQAVWDLLEDIKPTLQAAHFEMFGTYFDEVKAEPVVTPWGTYRGGYVPAKTDSFVVHDARVHGQMAELENDYRQSMPATPRGFTKTRVEGYRRELSLDVRRLVGHIDETLRFAHVQPAIRDALSLLKDSEFSAKLSRVDPSAIDTMLLPMLNRAASQRTTELHALGWVNRFLSGLRGRSGIALMFFNLVNTAQNVFNLGPALLRVKPGHLWAGLRQYMAHGSVEQISAESPWMADRFDNQFRDMVAAIDELVRQPGKFERVAALSQHHGYMLQRGLQNAMDAVIWLGAKSQAVAELTGDAETVQAEAVARADAAVRQTQGSLNAEDLSRAEVGTPLVKLLTMFYGFFNNLANFNATEYRAAMQAMGWQGKAGRLGMVYMLGFAVPMLLADLLVRAAADNFDDDDDETTLGDVGSWFVLTHLRSLAAFVPFGSTLLVPVNAFNNKPWDDRMLTSPAITALENATVGVARATQAVASGGPLTGKHVRDLLTLVSLVTGVPVAVLGKPLGYAVDEARGAKPSGSTLDYLRGLVVGR